jgi:hypothetical protein
LKANVRLGLNRGEVESQTVYLVYIACSRKLLQAFYVSPAAQRDVQKVVTFVASALQKNSMGNEFDDNLATSLCYNEQKGWWI